MPQSPKTTGLIQTTPTIKSEMDAKCLSANSTNNNTIFNFPTVQQSSAPDDKQINQDPNIHFRHHEGKELDVNDINVMNVDVVASSSSNHETNSSNSFLSMLPASSTNNSTNQSSSNLNVINVCEGGSDKNNPNGIIITEASDGAASFYDAIKLEDNGTATTAIIYETIVIENATGQQQELMSFVAGNNNKLIANKNEGGGIIVLTGSLNELLLGQSGGHVITNCSSQTSNGAGANTKCLNDVKTNTNHIQSIVLNLNSQSSASAAGGHGGQIGPSQKSITLSINPNQQVSFKHVR
jgi:hypothetical protein